MHRIGLNHALGLLGLALVVSAGGCPADHGHDPTHEASEPADHAHAGEGQEARLHLNAGKKWPMDEHTRGVVGELRRSLDEATLSSSQDVSALGGVIDGHLEKLVAGCTMTGEAHDQLHVFLTTFMPAVAAFAKESDLTKAKAKLQELRAAIVEYDRFFE